MQPSIPAETCCTGWLTALSGKALRRLMLLSLAFWLFFNTAPVCLPDLSFHILSSLLSACVYFCQHSFWLCAQLTVSPVCLFSELALCECVSFPYVLSSVLSTWMSLVLYLLIILAIYLICVSVFASFHSKPVCWFVYFPAYLCAVILLCLSYLSEALSLNLSVALSLCLSVCMFLYFRLCLFLYFSLIFFCIFLSAYFCTWLFGSFSVSTSVY